MNDFVIGWCAAMYEHSNWTFQEVYETAVEWFEMDDETWAAFLDYEGIDAEGNLK